MKNTVYTLQPHEYESLVEDRSTEFSARRSGSQRLHDLLPDFPISPGLKIDLNCPAGIKITTDDILSFTWNDVQFPLAFMAMLDNRHWLMRYEKQFVFLKNIGDGKIYSFWPDVRRHDLQPPAPASPLGPGYASAHFTYDMFYFYKELPRYSAEYEIWVQLGDIESNHRTFTLEFFVNAARILPPE